MITHGPACICAEVCTPRRIRSHEPIRDEQGRVLWRCRCGLDGASEVLHPMWWRQVEPDGYARVNLCAGCFVAAPAVARGRARELGLLPDESAAVRS